jgi:diguanylate cyclase (GGDEF)-like protein/PAS domain S-box-containing protein
MAIRKVRSSVRKVRGARSKPGKSKRNAGRGVAADVRRFRVAMENSADMIALIDRASMRYIDVNTTLCRRVGYTRRELLAMGPADIVVEGTIESLARDYDGLIADRTSQGTLRARYRCKNGVELPFESRRQVFRSGGHWVIAAISRDISEQVAVERGLRESEARFRSLTHLSSDWYWEQDSAFRFTQFAGPGAGTNKDGAPEIFLGRTRWETPDLEPMLGDWAMHRQQLERREPFRDLVLRQRMSDGTARYMGVSGEPMFDARGAFTGYRGVAQDITHRVLAERALRDSEARFRSLLELSSDMYWEQDAEFRFTVLSGKLPEWIREGRRRMIGRLRWDQHYFNMTEADWAAHRAMLEAHRSFRELELGRVNEKGQRVWVSVSGEPVFGDEGDFIGYRGVGRDITAQKRAQEALLESESRFRALTQMSSDFFWETDEQHKFSQLVHGPDYHVRFADAVIGKTAWEIPSTTPDEAGWAALRATIDAHEPIREFEFGRPRSGGGARHFSVSGGPRFAADGRFLGYRGVGRDITDLVLAREHIASLAFSDPLTGLANRTSLVPALEQAVERARRRSSRLATMFVDLDGFKQINDAHGHAVGDRFLVEVARRLRASLRASDFLARLGGDEFFVVLEDVGDISLLDTVANKLLAEILKPFEVSQGLAVSVSASIGISVFPGDAADASALMKNADLAMYQAKQAGKNAFRFLDGGAPSYERNTSSVS